MVNWAKEQLGQQTAEHSAAAARVRVHEAVANVGPLRESGRCNCIGSMSRHDGRLILGDPRQSRGLTRIRPRTGGVCGISRTAAGSVGFRDCQTARNALQVHNRYLVVETDAGIEVIDQHALHERILYEQIREKVLSGALESQRLLVPEPVDLTATEAAAALEHAELLAQLGVEVQPFGGETVLVSSYPAMLANLSPAEVLRELVEKLLAGRAAAGGPRFAGRAAAHDRLQGGGEVRRSAHAGGGRRAACAAAFGPGPASLPARPADGAGFYARRLGSAIQADLMQTGHRAQ